MSPFRQSVAALILALAPLATGCLAVTLPTDGYSMRVWQTDDGLPSNIITSAVQTRDGFLWFGTYGGLARFDGEQFQVFNSINTPELKDGRITCLFEDRHRTLWIGHETGLITRYHSGRFDTLPQSSSEKPESVSAIGSDGQGRMWAMRENGVLDLVNGRAHLPSFLAGYPPSVMAWTRSDDGKIWIAENGNMARLADGKLIPVALSKPRNTNFVLCVAASADGGVWVLCDDQIREWRDGHWAEDRGGYPWVAGSIGCALELHDGTLAVGTLSKGLYLIFRDGRPPVHFDQANGLPQNWVRFLYEDREGDLWVGAGSSGLAEIHTTAFSIVNAPDQWQAQNVLSVAPGRHGSLWIGTEGAGLYHDSNGLWAHYGNTEGLENLFVWAVDRDSEGRVWVGNWSGGPFRLENGRLVHPKNIERVAGPILAIENDPKTGGVLVGTRDGLLSIVGDHSAWLYRTTDGSTANVCAVVRDPKGVIWFGFATGGLARLAGRKLSFFGNKDGLVGEGVQCLFSDNDGSLWIGTDGGGITRFKDGHFARIGVGQGLASNVVGHITDDGLGYLWLNTVRGIQRVAKDELNRCADRLIPAIYGQIYDRDDGLPTTGYVGGRQAAGCKTTDGRLWFTSSKGLVSVDPSKIKKNPTPPPVVLESLTVDGKSLPLGGRSMPNRLPPGHHRLEFRFAGLSFVAPNKVHFKYRLDGIDESWVDAGNRRTAFYSRLPDGDYRFRVIACNNDGVWNTKGATLAFTVAPFFWQTWWFLTLAASLVLTSVALFARYLTHRRLQRRMEQLQWQHAVERERARIAQDIHDDIGTSLTRIAMFSQPDRTEISEPQRTAAVLASIYSATGEMTRSLDEIVWAVDPRHDTLDSLVSYLGRFATDLLGAANIRCRLDLPGEFPPWRMTAETRHHLFLAFKETLNNVLKHAAATEVRIAFQLRSDAFVLVVRDNGAGFDRCQPRSAEFGRIASGNGLPNLERRLARIGGRCEISSKPGEGTTVTFVVGVTSHARIPDPSPESLPPPSSPS